MRTLLAFVALVASGSAAAADQQVYLATLPGYPPFTFYQEDVETEVEETIPPGEDSDYFTGYSWQIARAAFHAVDWTIKLRITPWARGMMELREEKTDILFPTGKNPTRLEYMQYSNNSVVDVNFLIYKNAGDSIGYDGLRSLEGDPVAVLRDFNYGEAFNKADYIDKVKVDSIEQGFDVLEEGRVVGFAGYDIPWDYRLRQWGRAADFDKLPPFDGTKEFLAGLQDREAATEAIKAFDEGFRRIQENGTLAEIRQRWE